MKKSTWFTKILLLSLLVLNACSKKDQLGTVIVPPAQNLVATISAPLFDELNETFARFDPLYLQIVYKDNRSQDEINEEAKRLLTAIHQNPTSLVIQKELADLYHFKNFADLEKASNVISNNSVELKKSFFGKDTALSNVKMKQLNEARNTFLKNKIKTLEKASQRISSSAGQEIDDKTLEIWHYYGVIQNSMNETLDNDFGGGGGCNESCCYEFEGCRTNAYSQFLENMIKYTVGGIIGGGSVGFAAGTVVPVIGNLVGAGWGAIYGGWLAGTTGYVVATTKYRNDESVCVSNYIACMLRKKGK